MIPGYARTWLRSRGGIACDTVLKHGGPGRGNRWRVPGERGQRRSIHLCPVIIVLGSRRLLGPLFPGSNRSRSRDSECGRCPLSSPRGGGRPRRHARSAAGGTCRRWRRTAPGRALRRSGSVAKTDTGGIPAAVGDNPSERSVRRVSPQSNLQGKEQKGMPRRFREMTPTCGPR